MPTKFEVKRLKLNRYIVKKTGKSSLLNYKKGMPNSLPLVLLYAVQKISEDALNLNMESQFKLPGAGSITMENFRIIVDACEILQKRIIKYDHK